MVSSGEAQEKCRLGSLRGFFGPQLPVFASALSLFKSSGCQEKPDWSRLGREEEALVAKQHMVKGWDESCSDEEAGAGIENTLVVKETREGFWLPSNIFFVHLQELIRNKARNSQNCTLLEQAYAIVSALTRRAENNLHVSLIENYPGTLESLGEPIRQVTGFSQPVLVLCVPSPVSK